MARIVTVYNNWDQEFLPVEMGYIRWLKTSEALSRLGHQVDIATNLRDRRVSSVRIGHSLRMVPLSSVRWSDYDVVKTLFDVGFEILETHGGLDHPFIISKLGSVVGPVEMDGIYFYGEMRERLFSIQERIDRTSNYVAVISDPAKQLWETCFGPKENVLVVPGAADRHVPPPAKDPFRKDGRTRCVFAGNVYDRQVQPEANTVLVDKLNKLGKLLSRFNARLYMFGPGDVTKLDHRQVTYLGVVPYEEAWNYLHFADVGVVVAAGKYLHNNESTKIYHYLRVGLPVVSEAGFPNDHVVEESQLGFTVENGNLELMAERIVETARMDWDRDYAIRYILNNHTWDRRVEVYDQLIKRKLN